MKERPILFSTKMVKAILNGEKTMTRRIVKTHHCFKEWECTPNDAYSVSKDDAGDYWFLVAGDMGYAGPVECPYGNIGDRLWVKETFKDYQEGCGIFYRADMPIHIDAKDTEHGDSVDILDSDIKWTSPLFMSKCFSRITLEVVSVRVEKLQEITEEDAKREGAPLDCPIGYIPAYQKSPYVYSFAQLWEQINGEDSWDKDPWVWVIEFRRIK